MGLRPLLTLAAAATVALASPAPLAAREDAKIKWGDCEGPTLGPDDMQCAKLKVPRDYTDDSKDAKTLELSLARVPSVHESKGSILLNFGGPGSASISTLGSAAPLLHNMTGGHHDLVTFDPRGTGDTMLFSCFEEADEREYFFAKYPTPIYGSSDVSAGDLWANTGTFASVCNETIGEEGELIGTAFVARDMMKIVDALDEDGKLRYWGMSYGSTLGATTAAMFPDRIDKMVLDGIANPETYYHSFHLGPDQQAGTNAAWESFLEECIEAGDKKCALASLNDTASDLAETLDRAAESYRTDPVAISGVVITYSAVRSFYYNLLKTLGDVKLLTEVIAGLVTGEGLEEFGSELGSITSVREKATDDAIFGISCSDAIPRADNREEVMEEVEAEMASSRFGGEMPYSSMTCAQWPFEAKERKTVDEEVKTSPILIVGNTYDVATAVKSAYSLSELFPGSVVVEQKGYGHTSIAQRSKCTFKAMGNYFTKGELPDGNIECEVDTPLFGGEDTKPVSE